MQGISVRFHLTRPAAVLRATGPDAFTFLQSQFSNDLRPALPLRAATYGLWLDRKGKIQADSFILPQAENDFLLISYYCPVAMVRAHLEAHLIADEVELTDCTGDYSLLQSFMMRTESRGADPAYKASPIAEKQVTEQLLAHFPQGLVNWRGGWSGTIFSRDGFGSSVEVENLVVHLRKRATEVGAEVIENIRLMEGAPCVPFDAGPGDLPQEVGLDRHAVSFNKGCYLGQEVMARIQSQGHVNRALWRVMLKNEIAPAKESLPLFAGDIPAGDLRSHGSKWGFAMLRKKVIVGREGLSLTPNGDEVVRLTGNELIKDLTQS
jgi:folate-binding protein YgfZ